jgi:hypothetical protein
MVFDLSGSVIARSLKGDEAIDDLLNSLDRFAMTA